METIGQRNLTVLLIGGLLLCVGCRKDTNEPTPASEHGAGPTPYHVQVPSWLADSTNHAVTYPADNPSTYEGVALGRMLFYEKALSDDFSLSCGSCHKQENAFDDIRQFSIGTDGSVGTRQAMSIVNLNWDQFFFWDARSRSMEDQAFGPVVNPIEMRNTWPIAVQRLQGDADYPGLFEAAFGSPGIDSVRVVQAISQFERTLVSFNSRFDRFRYLGDVTALTESEQNGYSLFTRSAHCADCHIEPLFANHSALNNGLDLTFTDLGVGAVDLDPQHDGLFKVPSLRNIEVTSPYMHDGRFTTLEQVVDFYADDVHTDSPNMGIHMTPWINGLISLEPEDRADLVAFLRTLTDQEFLTNPAFTDPH